MIRPKSKLDSIVEGGPFWRIRFTVGVAPSDMTTGTAVKLYRNPRFGIDEDADEWLVGAQEIPGIRPFFDHEFFEDDEAVAFRVAGLFYAIPVC